VLRATGFNIPCPLAPDQVGRQRQRRHDIGIDRAASRNPKSCMTDSLVLRVKGCGMLECEGVAESWLLLLVLGVLYYTISYYPSHLPSLSLYIHTYTHNLYNMHAYMPKKKESHFSSFHFIFLFSILYFARVQFPFIG